MRVDITIPVLNEEQGLEDGVGTLRRFIESTYGSMDGFAIVIADNGSDDRTPEIARRLADQFSFVRHVRLEEKGVGRALKAAWLPSDAEIVGYMDLDMSTDLKHLPEALDALTDDNADIVYGSRLQRGSAVEGRRLNRAIISRVFNLIVRNYLGVGISDGMCGFKFLRRSVLDDLMAGGAVSDGWFFSTELIVVAEWLGFKVRELPVRWTDDPVSRVRVIPLALSYLKAMRLLKQRRPAQVAA